MSIETDILEEIYEKEIKEVKIELTDHIKFLYKCLQEKNEGFRLITTEELLEKYKC